ncbi:acyl-CoA thioesterase [Brevibacillus daliensis]|uniref:acyl-CoA thioesterase n=1 Tax=Brevibacillus daliensis TaxID=2892995 RepID=UPI001E562CE5|nr:thioesterase family protein [Brevibacillus daliensis]
MVQNTVQLKVNWGDTDMAGIIYYPNYFKWFDIGSLTLVNELGLSVINLMQEDKIGLPLLDAGCRFRKALLYNDEIRVVSRVTEVNEKTFRVEHEVYRNDEMTGNGHELRGWVQFDEFGNLKAVPIPDEVRKLLTEDKVLST